MFDAFGFRDADEVRTLQRKAVDELDVVGAWDLRVEPSDGRSCAQIAGVARAEVCGAAKDLTGNRGVVAQKLERLGVRPVDHDDHLEIGGRGALRCERAERCPQELWSIQRGDDHTYVGHAATRYASERFLSKRDAVERGGVRTATPSHVQPN
jgi:hypothetical protein